MNKSTCHGCGARIVFIKMITGKYMPCDPAPVYYHKDPNGLDRIVLQYGVVMAGTITKNIDGALVGYRPHWATCPQANKFKK